MAANLLPISSQGGFITAGDIGVIGTASPAPRINGFDSGLFSNTVVSGNLWLNSGYIKGGTPTVVSDGINAIYAGITTTMDVYGFPFTQITRGQLTISGDITPTEAVGTWYYQSINTNTFEIFTDSTYSTPVDSTSWASYSGGATVDITKQIPAANVVIDSNGYLTKFNNDGEVKLSGNLVLPNNTFAINYANGTQVSLGSGSTLPLANGNSNINIATSGGNVTVTANSTNTWTFDDTGNLTIPGSSGGFIKTVANASIGIAVVDNGTNNPAQMMSFNQGLGAPTTIISTYASNALIQSNVTGTMNTWRFDNTGNLTLPGNTFAVKYANGTQISLGGSNISNGNSNVNIATANGNVTISAVGNNVVTITGTGANITGTANITGNTYSGSNSATGFTLGNVNSKFAAVSSNSYIQLGQNPTIVPDTSASAFAGVLIGGNGYLLANNGARVFTLGTDGSATVTANVSLPNGGHVVAGGNVQAGGSLIRTGSVTGTAWGTAGIGLKIPTSFYTDNSSPAGTITTSYIHSLAAPTLVQSNAVTITNAATLFVAAPTAGSNATITNSFAMIANGNVQVNGTAGISMPNLPAFRVYGSGVTSISTTTNTTGIVNSNNWTVDYNQGSYLNSSTGVFTAPVAGLYSVNLVARVANNTAPTAQAIIYKNYGSANTVEAMWESGANPTINHFGVSTVSKLAVGDTLTFKVTVGTMAFDGNDNWSVAYLG